MTTKAELTYIFNSPRIIYAGLLAILAFTALCYWPSLTGPFIFDDHPNLSPLGAFGGIDSWEKFIHFISSGGSGPLGRPVSLASFVLNAQNWPANPYPFRLTNLAIHLFNGLLVFCLAIQLQAARYPLAQARQMALLSTAIWLLHPLLVSTTAFIVQRMTQLSCSFVLLGLIGYLHGRSQLMQTPTKGWIWIFGSMGIAGSLAILSKETGVLLPLFTLCIEATVFANDKSAYRRRLLLLFGLPVLAIAANLAMRLPGIETSFLYRDFTLVERLLTESRILIDYLSHILAPRMEGAGLYHDDFPISSGLLSPPSTLASLMVLSLLFLLGCKLRFRYPFLSLGILWFFAGHCLESSIIPLELYYEHRNYVPMIGLALAAGQCCLATQGRMRRIALLIATLFITLEAFITWQNAVMWSSQRDLVHISVQEHPTSLRALERAALYYAAKQDYRRTLPYLETAVVHHPDKHSMKLSVIQTKCLLNELNETEVLDAAQLITYGKYEKESIQYLPEFMRLTKLKACYGLTHSSLLALLEALEIQSDQPGPGTEKGLINYYRAVILAETGQHTAALEALGKANALSPTFDSLLLQVVWLISISDYTQAQHYLDIAKQMNAERLSWAASRSSDIQGFQSVIDNKDANPALVPFEYPFKRLRNQ